MVLIRKPQRLGRFETVRAAVVTSINEKEFQMADRTTATTDRNNAAGNTVEDDLAALRADLKSLTATISGLAKDKSDNVRAKLGETADKAIASGKQTTENIQDTVRDRPITSVAIAFGVGMLIAHLLDRR